MRLVVYAFIFAVVFLIVKAFFLDDYIAEYKQGESNATAEANVTSEPNASVVIPEPLPPKTAEPAPSIDVSGMAPAKEEPKTSEPKKMPLDQLGDDLSKHIKL